MAMQQSRFTSPSPRGDPSCRQSPSTASFIAQPLFCLHACNATTPALHVMGPRSSQTPPACLLMNPLPSPARSSPSVPPAKGKMPPTAPPSDSVDVDVQIAYQVMIQPVIPHGRPIHPSLGNSSTASAFSQEGGKLRASHTGRARSFEAKYERP